MARRYHMTGLDLLGADLPMQLDKADVSPWNGAAALGGGILGALVWRKHPVLGFLGASALASNTHAVATKQRTWKRAAERVGQTVVATAGSLALPSHPAIGYVAAAIAADLLIDEKGQGLLQEWVNRAKGIHGGNAETIDAQVVDVKPDDKTKALVKK